ncbi:MAG: hypothetical protein L6R35_006021 [Caloplaca aegaea]|nr:MAG: hypothetical protein L6R35_006021 [Caloplaca aegaea]
MTDFQAVAQQFTDFYYTTFDRNRSDLAALYVRSSSTLYRQTPPPFFYSYKTRPALRDQSMLTFESSPVQGASGIVEKLVVRPSLLPAPQKPRNRFRRAKLLLFLSSLIKGLRK